MTTFFLPLVMNTVGVNAGELDGPKGEHRNDFTPPGPLLDAFRFGTTYASVAPVAPPKLAIQMAGPDVQIRSPAGATGYTLQQTDNLATSPWIPAPVDNPVAVPATAGARFYRLSE